ncbi:MAG: dihydropyrimidine dehydrogenase, partial [Acidobacteria bacterium]|nr:dihydropyrimidine dehydrogenase [Acidobacteriota bacterium]
REHDAVFLGLGLGGVNALGVDEEATENVRDAIDFIAELRQVEDLATLPVGRRVVVIGGGMTAVDAAVQSKLLGAEDVAMVYRRGRERMNASGFELDHAASNGVRILTDARPVRVLGSGAVREVEFAYTEDGPDGLRDTGETFRLQADQVFKAIGQKLDESPDGLAIEGRRIRVTGPGRTSRQGVWAGGDCVADGDDLVVTAVAQGRDAAEDIHATLTG